MNTHAKTLLMLALPLALAGCGKDDPIGDSQVKSAEILCTYSMSPELLNYFDYTFRYTNDYGYTEYVDLNRPNITLNLNATELPSEKFFKFTVTRKNTPAPSEQVEWTRSFDVRIVRHYIDEHTDTVTASNSITDTPAPANFEQWATTQYIPLMEQGYEIYINFAGVINFSFD